MILREHTRLRAATALLLVALMGGVPTRTALAQGRDPSGAPRVVWAFGATSADAMGEGGDPLPHPVRGLGRMVAVAGGSAFTLSLDASGRVFAWGNNFEGELGNGTHGNSQPHPVQVAGLPTISVIDAGDNHALALATDGTIWAWGSNERGQIGNGQAGGTVDVPFHVPGVANAVAIAGGGAYSLAVLADGSMVGWGSNDAYQLGLGGDIDAPVTQPTALPAISGVVKASGGGAFSVALKQDGTVWAWGSNRSGESSGWATPQQEAADATDIAAGREHGLALRSDGTVVCWGSNLFGQCGATTTPNTIPAQVVPNLQGVVDVAAGIFTSYALDSAGKIWAWGDNGDAELGDGTHTTGQHYAPQMTVGPRTATAIDAGSQHAFALAGSRPVFAVAPGPGGGPHVQVFDVDYRRVVAGFYAYAPSFTGGVDVAVGDVNRDGVPDIVTGAGPGGGPHIRVFGLDGTLMSEFMAFAASFTGGVHVTTADTNGDGTNEIVVGAGPGGGPHVRVFDRFGSPVGPGFFAYSPDFHGGVDVAGLRVGNHDVIVTGAGPGGGPHVKTLDVNGDPVGSGFLAYGADFHGGVSVAAGRPTANGAEEIVTAAGPGGGPHVRLFSSSGTPAGAFDAYASNFTGGVDVGGLFLGTTDTFGGVITGPGPGGGPHVRAFNDSGGVLFELFAYAPSFTGGVRVAAERSHA
ncbi:MAG: hypothetical protein QOI61_594 [Actinomycetota bacterium]